MKRTKKLLSVALALLVLIVFSSPSLAASSIADEAVPYTFGETYSGTINSKGKAYKFYIEKKSNVYFEITTNKYYLYELDLFDASGKELIDEKDMESSKNEVTDTWFYSNTRILQPGQYYLKFRPYSTAFCTLFITCEDAITLTKPSITKISSSTAKKMKFELSEVENRTGYEVQYSTSSKFKNAKKVTCDTSKTISKLTKGKTYYVRARAFAIYV